MTVIVGDMQTIGTAGWWMTDLAYIGALENTAEENLRVLLSNSTTFQTWTSTANATAALARIHIPFIPPGATLPAAAIGSDEGEAANSAGTGGVVTGGSLPLYLESEIGGGATEMAALSTHKTSASAIVAELMELTYTYAGALVLQSITAIEHSRRTRGEEGDATDVYTSTYSVEHGIGG
jgi:hypothetical protein